MELEFKRAVLDQKTIIEILGCKWTIKIIQKISEGLSRPSEIERSLPGLTAKILNQRLKKLERKDILGKKSYPGYPLHVEYSFDSLGDEIVPLVKRFLSFDISIVSLSNILSCKWMLRVLCSLYRCPMRSNELKKSIKEISYKVLSERLHKLEDMGLVNRELIGSRPPGVIYSLTDNGRKFAAFMRNNGFAD